MGKGTTSARKQRRQDFNDAGFLKIKNQFGFFSPQARAWYGKMREDGTAAESAHTNRVNDSIEDQLQLKLNASKQTWSETGYNDSEILKLEEAWTIQTLRDPETLKEDKKAIKSLRKEAQQSLIARKNARD